MTKPQKSVFALALVVAIDGMGFGLLIPVLFPLLMDPQTGLLVQGVSSAQRHLLMSITLSIFPLSALLCTPFLGALSDRFGRKKILLFCLLGSVLGYSLSAFGILAKSFLLFLLGRVLAGITFGSQPIAQAAISDSSVATNKALNMSLISFAITLSITLGPILGGYLTDPHICSFFNNSTPFIVAALLSLINAVWLWWVFEETMLHKAVITRVRDLFGELKILWKVAYIRRLLLVFVLLEIGWSFYFQCIGLFLQKNYQFTSIQIGNFLSYSGLWMCFGLLILFRWLYKILSLRTLAKSFFVLAFLGLVVCAYAIYSYQQWLGVIVVAIAVGIAYTALITLLSNAVEANFQGRTLGLAGSLLTFAWMLTGFLGPNLAAINVLYPLIAAAVTIGLGVLLMLVKLPQPA